ncbi:MAG: orotate phosphoribosyltransferase [Clostridia bacterium]|nr:orotate phosphoribosyltransferase [Clostridia bacterium]MBQ4297658.1 orotate phosphoribosyltransferase [Clostridia bacterium]
MPSKQSYKIQTKRNNLFLRVCKGHFATSHSHINYYIDVTMQKSRLSEAKAVARELVSYYNSSTIIDTILCLDGMEVIGTCLADELTEGSFLNLNAHGTIYVMTPEHTSGSQLIFRDSTAPMIEGKNVLVLAASVTTGFTARGAIEAIRYYGGIVAGVAAIFATTEDCMGYPVKSVFNPNDLSGYASYSSHECPMCRAGQPVDALVNSFGFSKL